MQEDGLMRIGELSRQSGLTIRAIRYYEEYGLLEPVSRTRGNYRLYDRRALGILKTVKRLKVLGMSLENIAEIKDLYTREGDCTNSLRERFLEILQERMQQINDLMEELTVLREELGAHYRRLSEFLASHSEEGLNRNCRDSLGIPPQPIPSPRVRS